jgi:hypothetical protein
MRDFCYGQQGLAIEALNLGGLRLGDPRSDLARHCHRPDGGHACGPPRRPTGAGRAGALELTSATSRRVVALLAFVRDDLRAHRARQLQDGLPAGSHWHDDPRGHGQISPNLNAYSHVITALGRAPTERDEVLGRSSSETRAEPLRQRSAQVAGGSRGESSRLIHACKRGAASGIRTQDLRFTKPLLYH